MQQLIEYLFYSGPKPTASYALLDFADKGRAIVHLSNIVEGSLSDRRCRVKWYDGKQYDGDMAFTGKDSKATKI